MIKFKTQIKKLTDMPRLKKSEISKLLKEVYILGREDEKKHYMGVFYKGVK